MENKNIEEIMSEFRGFFDEIENMKKEISNTDKKIENNRLTISHLNSDIIPADKEFKKSLEEKNSGLEEENSRKKIELEDKKSYDYAMKEDTIKSLTQGKIKLEKERHKLEISMKKKNNEIEEFFAEDGEKTKTIDELYKEKDEIQNNINDISKEMEIAEIYINEAKLKEVTSKQYKEIHKKEEQSEDEKLEDEQTESQELPTQAQKTAMDEKSEIEGISTSEYEMMSIEEKNDLLNQSKKEFITKYAMLFADKTDKQQDDIYNSLRGKLANELVDELRKNKTTPQISKQTQPAPVSTQPTSQAPAQSTPITPTQPQSANPTKTQAMTMDEASGKTEQDKSMIYEALKEKFDWNMEIERDFEGVTTPNKTGEIEGYYNDEIDENNINEQLEKHQIEGLNLETVKYIMENGDPAITAMLINEKEKLVEYYKLMTNNDYKDNSRLKIKYNLKEKLFSRIDRQTRKEIKEYAYKAREYAQIEAGPITKMQFKIKEMVEKSKQKRIEAKSNKYDKKFVKDYTKEKVQGPLTKQQETILEKKEQQQNKFKNLLKIEQGEIKLTSEGKEQTISRDDSPEHDSK